jgi:micrococcal nuclease
MTPKPIYRARAMHFYDGDTISARLESGQRKIIRLSQIDAPEKTQDYGIDARVTLAGLLRSKAFTFTLDPQITDQYGRLLAEIFTPELCVNLELVRLGAAHVYDKYCDSLEYIAAENSARQNARGLWFLSSKPIMPWDFRKKQKAANL